MLITFNKGDIISNKNVDKNLELQANKALNEIIEQLIINYKLYALEKDDNLSIGAQKLKELYEKLFYPCKGVI